MGSTVGGETTIEDWCETKHWSQGGGVMDGSVAACI